jgi:hypothetical protein
MEEKKKDIIKFQMSNLNKFIYYKMGLIVIYLSLGFIIFSIIVEVITKSKLIEILKISLSISAFFIIVILPGFWRMKHAKWASELTIDKEKKEFRSYIYDIKEEVLFKVNDIIEVGSSPEIFRFFLKDGTWVSWAKDEASQQSLEEIIKSFGISVISKKLW